MNKLSVTLVAIGLVLTLVFVLSGLTSPQILALCGAVSDTAAREAVKG